MSLTKLDFKITFSIQVEANDYPANIKEVLFSHFRHDPGDILEYADDIVVDIKLPEEVSLFEKKKKTRAKDLWF